MVVDFSKVDLRERPVLILLNTADEPIGVLGKATNIAADIKYNETSVLTFDIAAEVDGEPTPHYDAVRGFRTVDLQSIGRFILMNPEEKDDGIKQVKSCKAYSLEYEFTLKKITLDNATYNFWNPVAPESTLLGIILEKMPSWKVGHIDSALIGKYRTFDVADENIYNFMKGTAQNAYNCIFDFDTYTREINVRDASFAVAVNPVFLSSKNLVKEIVVKENTENIVTRLDVNGADGVNIRDVNPSGTNDIINLDYFMTLDNFSQTVINKYRTWKKTYQDYQLPYYNLSIEYSLQVMRKTTEQAALVDLQGERTVLENEQATIIQGMAMDVVGMNQQKLNDVNTRIAAKNREISSKQAEIDTITSQCDSIYAKLAEINKKVRFQSFFTEAEHLLLDRYIRDDSVSESSFVAQEVASYSDEDKGSKIVNMQFDIRSAEITRVTNSSNKDIYDITGGTWRGGDVDAEIIHAAFEMSTDNSFVLTAYLGKGAVGGEDFPKGCLSITGKVSSVSSNVPVGGTGSTLTVIIQSGYMYFTHNTSEYEKREVAWDLYEYGNEILEKISQPSYTFNVTSANFLHLEEFETFKNRLRHGEKLYVALDEERTLCPVFIGANFEYGDMSSLTLEFSDTYVSSDSSFLLADLLEQSVSMGKSTDLSKFTYSAFVDSGASTKVKYFMTAALDVAKNAIISSQNQAVSWDDTGIRLRKWANDRKTAYDPKQVWMNNNSILMTSNNWSTAELAIGNFHDENLGDCWGIVAPNIVGTLLAGSNLVIESTKKDGSGVAVFRVDGEGCVLHNANISVTSDKTKTRILLDPDHGFVIGARDVLSAADELNTAKAVFYADANGDLTLKGTIYASAGEFTGKITALSGYIGQASAGWTIGNTFIYNGKGSFASGTEGVYIGTNGISLGTSSKYIRASKNGLLEANNVSLTGAITATSGIIGGCVIENNKLIIKSANIADLSADKITSGTMSADRISGGTIDATNVSIVNLNASNIKSGTIDASRITVKNLSATNITSGTLNCSNFTVKNLRADSISVGKINASQINGLPASQITSGTFGTSRIPELNCSKITSGTFDAVRIPNLSCDKITTGQFSTSRIPNLSANKITTGTLSANRVSGGTLTGCSIRIGSFYVNSSGTVSLGAVNSMTIYSGGRYYTGITDRIPYMNNTIDQWLLTVVKGLVVGYRNN